MYDWNSNTDKTQWEKPGPLPPRWRMARDARGRMSYVRPNGAPQSEKPAIGASVGSWVDARYKNGKWYPAQIVAVDTKRGMHKKKEAARTPEA